MKSLLTAIAIPLILYPLLATPVHPVLHKQQTGWIDMVLLIGGCMHGIICVDNGMFLDFFIISHSMHKKQRLAKTTGFRRPNWSMTNKNVSQQTKCVYFYRRLSISPSSDFWIFQPDKNGDCGRNHSTVKTRSGKLSSDKKKSVISFSQITLSFLNVCLTNPPQTCKGFFYEERGQKIRPQSCRTPSASGRRRTGMPCAAK